MTGHWPSIADRWAQVGPPLRPSSADVKVFASLIPNGSPCRAIIFGVTPELVKLPWPTGSAVLAVDHTEPMIRAVWPGPPSHAVLADWRSLPVRRESLDLALCDGGLHLLNYPDGQLKFVSQVSSCLRSGGRFGLRLFLPPAKPEPEETVISDLVTGRIPNLNVLKLRLGHSLCQSSEVGVAVRDLYQRVEALAPSLGDLAIRLGWKLDHLRAIESYRESLSRYHFINLEQTAALFGNVAGSLKLEKIVPGKGILGSQCPISVWRKGSPN